MLSFHVPINIFKKSWPVIFVDRLMNSKLHQVQLFNIN
jgi:hypothetical protein